MVTWHLLSLYPAMPHCRLHSHNHECFRLFSEVWNRCWNRKALRLKGALAENVYEAFDKGRGSGVRAASNEVSRRSSELMLIICHVSTSHHHPHLRRFTSLPRSSPLRMITTSHHHQFASSPLHNISTSYHHHCRVLQVQMNSLQWNYCVTATFACKPAENLWSFLPLGKVTNTVFCYVFLGYSCTGGGEEYCELDYAGLQRVRIQKFEIRGQCKWGVKVTTVRSCNSRAIAFTVSTASRVGTTANYCTASTASRWLLLVCVCACALWVLGVSLSLRLCEMLHQDAIRDSCTWLNQMSNDSSRVFFTEPRGAMCLGSKALNSHGQTSLPSCRKFPIRVSCAGVTVLYLYSDRLKTCITAVVKFMQRHAWFKSPVVLPVMFAPLPG